MTTPADYQYLNRGATKFFAGKANQKILASKGLQSVGLQDSVVDDFRDFGITDESLSHLGLTDEEKLLVYATVAAVLHLGNIAFEDSGDTKDGCRITKNTDQSLIIASALLGVDKEEMKDSLTCRVVQAARGGMKGTVIRYLNSPRLLNN